MTEQTGNGEYTRDQRLILYRLDTITNDLREARKDLGSEIKELRKAVAVLKIATASRSAIWGAVGSLPAIALALLAWMKFLSH